MCTAITYGTKDHYFGRTLDLEGSYGEEVTVTPRKYPFQFRRMGEMKHHYAMIGMACVVEGYPLYYEATNEKGLSIAGLNFEGNADYKPAQPGKDDVAPFELIPWLLGQCSTVAEVKVLLKRINLVQINFSASLPLSPLHWLIADRDGSITLESVKEGIRVYDNPVGVLTNNPTFDVQLFHLDRYLRLSNEAPAKQCLPNSHLCADCPDMGALGLPGDFSSASRFVKVAFVKNNSISGDSESESISQFFHILDSVSQPRGCVHMGDERYMITVYTSCCNTDKGIYYYTTYENNQISGVDMRREDLDGCSVISYPLVKGQQVRMQN